MLRETLRRLGPIAWRDARIAELRSKVQDQQRRIDKLRTQAARAATPPPPPPARYQPKVSSWHARIMEQQRVQRSLAGLDGAREHPRRNLFLKLHNYEVARSHGVATPQVLGVWQTAAEIELDSLPDQFVLKSNGGSTGRGVLPLERHEDRFRLVDGTRTYTAEEIVDHYAEAKGARPPYFAETLLPGSDVRLPDDVKIYAFYGEVAYVMIRRMPVHADTSQGLVRVLSPTGEDLDEVQRGRSSDTAVPVPAQLSLMVETAATLSLAVPLPYIRVDLYGSEDGIVLGELTPLPGDSQTFSKDWDRTLGEMYDRAEARLQLDLTKGRPYAVVHGAHDRSVTTAMAPSTRAPSSAGWRQD